MRCRGQAVDFWPCGFTSHAILAAFSSDDAASPPVVAAGAAAAGGVAAAGAGAAPPLAPHDGTSSLDSHASLASSSRLHGPMRWTQRLWVRLARAPQAVAGRAVAQPLPPRECRAAQSRQVHAPRRRRGRGRGTARGGTRCPRGGTLATPRCSCRRWHPPRSQLSPWRSQRPRRESATSWSPPRRSASPRLRPRPRPHHRPSRPR